MSYGLKMIIFILSSSSSSSSGGYKYDHLSIHNSFTSWYWEEEVDMEKNKCENCGSKFSRKDNLKRHQNKCEKSHQDSLSATEMMNLHRGFGVEGKEEKIVFNKKEITTPPTNKEEKSNYSQALLNSLINENESDAGDEVHNGNDYIIEGANDIERDITRQRYDESEDDNAEDTDMTSEDENVDDTDMESENEHEQVTNKDDDSDNHARLTDFDAYLLKGVHSSRHLEDRLYRNVNNMKVYGLDLDADRGLTNVQILEYIDLLKVPKFRGVFMRDELPESVNTVECGIVNLSPHEQLGTHWICYAKIHNNRIYFDSFGRKTPLEIQKYLKTEKEFQNNIPVIQNSSNIIQRLDTTVCGHLCIFVLTSLLREHVPFQKVIDELNYGFSEHYW